MGNPLSARTKRAGRISEPLCLDGEEWRSVAGFPGYEVSSLGRLRAIRILTTRAIRGYAVVGLYTDAGRQRNQRINRLVCEAFNGPSEGRDAAHLDGDCSNNRAANLVWATRTENTAHKLLHGTCGNTTEAKIIEVRRRVESGQAQKDIAADLSINPATVSRIARGLAWASVTEESA